jgi:riboflavin synthase
MEKSGSETKTEDSRKGTNQNQREEFTAEEKENMDKQELRCNVADRFISHNANLAKLWHDPQSRKEVS